MFRVWRRDPCLEKVIEPMVVVEEEEQVVEGDEAAEG